MTGAAFAALVADHDLISFDVFDTLVVRAVDRPTDVFELVKAKLLVTRAALLNPDTIDAFADLRVRAERVARDEKVRRADCDEVTFDEIYATFARLSGADADLVDLLKQTELDTEHDVVYPDPSGASLFDQARAQGKTVVLCSDMYLPADAVRSLLRRCGYDGWDELYVSCEHACSKSAGTMFEYVAGKHAVPTARILHVGDNAHGDVAMAERAGCTALHVPPVTGLGAPRMPWNGERRFSGDVVASIVAGIQRKYDKRTGAVADPWEELGFRVFGPLLTGFSLWLRVAIERRRPDRILFFARDTQLIMSFLQRSFAAGGVALPPSDYVYASRQSLLLASMTDFPLHRLNHLFSGRSERTLDQHLRRLGLEPDVLSNIVRSAGFASADDRVRNGDPRMRDLLGMVQHLLLRESARRRPLVQAYLEQFVDGANDVMLVDVGWVGNVQASFVRLLRAAHPAMRVRGHYAGVFSSAADNAMLGHTMVGWLARPDDPPRFEQAMWWSGGVELLEFAMAAPHGTTLGYERRDDGTIVPIIERSAVERETAAFAVRVQRGATAFFDEFLESFGGVPADGLDSRAWGSAFYRLVTDPSPAEVELLGDLTHSDAAGATAVRLPLAPKLADPRDADGLAQQCYWKSGLMVRNGLTVDEAYNEAVYLALNPDVRFVVEADGVASGYAHWIEYGRREGRIASWAAWMRRQRGAPAA